MGVIVTGVKKLENASEFGQEMLQSHIPDQPMAS